MKFRGGDMFSKVVKIFLIFSSLCFLITFFCYAGNSTKKDVKETGLKAPEFIIQEQDLTYDSFKDALKFLRDAVERLDKGEKYDPNSEENYIGIPNSLLRLEGYGLKLQRDNIKLELKNAKLIGSPKEKMGNLESKLKESEKQLQYFLEHNLWND
ncbi:MAG: hypothetical protein HQL27_02430 [Candidatus Omnitrophica bacterium]|nr:hypothetical protein [Candidatus Omnitrophota bacterium]